jgi:hypothetical protein
VGEDACRDHRATHQDTGSIDHPDAIQPALARRIVEEYSKPRALVIDLTGGAVLVEAATRRQRPIGIWPDHEEAALASDNLRQALGQRQSALTEFRSGDIGGLPEVLEDVVGAVDLVCVSPAIQPRSGPWWASTIERPCPSASKTPDEEDAAETAMAATYAGCFEVLRPGGLLVVVTTALHRGGELVDLAGTTVSQGRRAGFSYFQHVVALRAPIRHSALRPPTAISRPAPTGRASRPESSAHRVVHDDLTVLRKPVETETGHAS